MDSDVGFHVVTCGSIERYVESLKDARRVKSDMVHCTSLNNKTSLRTILLGEIPVV
jgi:hypothetical protein